MPKLSARIRNNAEQFYSWVLPREIELPDFLIQILSMVYRGKNMEWKLVKFHFGLPWFMHYATNEASTQPGTYDGHSIHVYYRKSMWSPYSIRGLSTIVHECFHVMQYRQVLDGWGVGYFRFFLILYFSGYASLGRSRKHLIELPAYSEEDKFRECLEKTLTELGITDPEESFLERQEEVLEHFKGKCPDISPHAYKINFWKLMYALTPGAFKFHNYYFGRILLFPWMVIWNLIALAATILFAVLKPLLESILLVGYLIMLAAAGACALVRL